MTYGEFIKQYNKILKIAMGFSLKATREGLLALENEIGSDAIKDMEILKLGIRLVVDGSDGKIVEKIFLNRARQEKDEDMRVLINMQKDAVLLIQNGLNPGFIYAVLNSYKDIKNKNCAMTRDDFLRRYSEIVGRTCKLFEKAKKEGLSSLKNDLDHVKADAGDIFELGLRLALDGIGIEAIEEQFSVMAEQERDEYLRMLSNTKKESVLILMQCEGYNIRYLYLILISCADLTDLTSEEIDELFQKDKEGE